MQLRLQPSAPIRLGLLAADFLREFLGALAELIHRDRFPGIDGFGKLRRARVAVHPLRDQRAQPQGNLQVIVPEPHPAIFSAARTARPAAGRSSAPPVCRIGQRVRDRPRFVGSVSDYEMDAVAVR